MLREDEKKTKLIAREAIKLLIYGNFKIDFGYSCERIESKGNQEFWEAKWKGDVVGIMRVAQIKLYNMSSQWSSNHLETQPIWPILNALRCVELNDGDKQLFSSRYSRFKALIEMNEKDRTWEILRAISDRGNDFCN